jgi:VanZ family protein
MHLEDRLKMDKKIIWWFLTALWCVAIFYQSNKPAELSDMDSLYIVELINNLLKTIFGAEIVSISNFIVRKSAHFIEYMVLGILFFISYYNGKLKNVFLISFLSGLAYSVSDELHQIFVPGRTAKIIDVGVDSTGIITGLCLITFFILRKRRSAISRVE